MSELNECNPTDHDFLPIHVKRSIRSFFFVFYDRRDDEMVMFVCRKCGKYGGTFWTTDHTPGHVEE